MISSQERRAHLLEMLASQPETSFAMTVIAEGDRAIVSIAARDGDITEAEMSRDEVPAFIKSLGIRDRSH